jgi:hypothetical protein
VLRTAAAAAVLAVLAGCGSQPLPQPRPAEKVEAAPVVMHSQVERVRAAVEAALAAGDKALDPEPLKARVAGPALELRQTGYTIRRKLPDQAAPPANGGELLADISPAAGGWPRFFLTATRPADDAVPQLQLLTQASARDPYRLTAWAHLLPGVTLPQTSVEQAPEALRPADADGLKAAPADVVAGYADVLTKAKDSGSAKLFAEDPFRAQVLGEQNAEREAVSQYFDYGVTHAPRKDAVWAVRTEDGGALVIGVLQATRTFTSKAPGAKLPLPKDLAVLAGKEEATQKAEVTSLEVVAFAVPPEGSDDPVTVVAGERGPLSAKAS